MKIHSDIIDASDINQACSLTGGAYIDVLERQGSRKRKQGYKIKLLGTSNRWVNSGYYGAGSERAATWDQWGVFLAALYKLDPNMACDYYDNAKHFHERTEGKFAA